MNLKNVTKTGLNNFIESKVRTQKAEIRTEIETIINGKLNPALQQYIDVKKIEDLAAKFSELLATTLEKYKKPLDSWKYSEVIQKVNTYIVPLSSKIKEEVKNKMNEYIENPQKGAYDFGDDNLNKTLTELQGEARPLYKRISDLTKLKVELERVIKNEPTGGRGYKSLVALGVDMEGYEERGVNLPAIVNLSVDVCVLNGNCQGEKESA